MFQDRYSEIDSVIHEHKWILDETYDGNSRDGFGGILDVLSSYESRIKWSVRQYAFYFIQIDFQWIFRHDKIKRI